MECMEGVRPGHRAPLDGLLEAFGWHGKPFDGPDQVHPLVFDHGSGLFTVNPAFLAMGLVLRHAGRNGDHVHGRLRIHDAFPAIDDTVLGAMDMHGMPEPFLFVLPRETATVPVG
jgi:GXWXG protein